MNTAEILSLVSLISFIVAGVCLVLAIVLWFVFKIPAVIGDLSGRTARKSIERMRSANESSGNKSYRASSVNASRGKLTGTMASQSKGAKSRKAAPVKKPAEPAGMVETGLLAENRAEQTDSQQTALLDETVILPGAEATGLLIDEDATMPLDMPAYTSKRSGGVKLTMINEVILIHTNEVI